MKRLALLIIVISFFLPSCDSNDPQPSNGVKDAGINVGDNAVDDDSTSNTTAPLSYFFPGSSTWETLAPDSLNLNASALSDIISFLGERNTYGFIMLYKGRIVVEKYWNGWDESTSYPIASASKSIAALLTGIAQENRFLSIADKSSKFLGEGWSMMSKAKEDKITVRHHLSMTTGMDENFECMGKECFRYKSDAGNRWAYHNSAYFLLHRILERASGLSMNDLTKKYLSDIIGLSHSAWEDFNISLSTRDMARFGLLIANKGKWDNKVVIADSVYYQNMLMSSNNKNEAYGFLWWINGKNSFMVPGDNRRYTGPLVPSAPEDLVSAMGKGDKKIYVLPSKHLVIVRHGDDTGDDVFGPSSFDSDLWAKLSPLIADMKTP